AHPFVRADGTAVPELEPNRDLAAEQVANERRKRSGRAGAPPRWGVGGLHGRRLGLVRLARSRARRLLCDHSIPPTLSRCATRKRRSCLTLPTPHLTGEPLPRLPAPMTLASGRGSRTANSVATEPV